MAKPVIDGFEAVQIQVTNRQGSLLSVGVLAGFFETLLKQLTVGQASKVIVVRCSVQLTGVVLQGCDISKRSDMVILPRFFQVDATD